MDSESELSKVQVFTSDNEYGKIETNAYYMRFCIEALKKNLEKAKFIEEGYKYSLIFDNISIIMYSGRNGITFNIRINQANNVWFEVFGNDVSLKNLIIKKREQSIMEKNKHEFTQLEDLFQKDMGFAIDK